MEKRIGSDVGPIFSPGGKEQVLRHREVGVWRRNYTATVCRDVRHNSHRDRRRRHLHVGVVRNVFHRDRNGGMGMIGALVMVVLAPAAAMLVQMAIMKTRTRFARSRIGEASVIALAD
jgi:hypothetical protein